MTTNPIPKRRILLVDDDMLTLTTIGQVLRQAGYETAEASSGAEALQVELEFSPDLAILDVVMEGMSGIELAQHFQAATATPFMFISARGEAEIVRQASEHGAVGYLVKPFDISQIVPAVETALGRADEIKRDQHGGGHVDGQVPHRPRQRLRRAALVFALEPAQGQRRGRHAARRRGHVERLPHPVARQVRRLIRRRPAPPP